MTLRIGWFSTGRGPGSRKLLGEAQQAIASGHLEAQLAAVFCNRERGEDPDTDIFLDLVNGYGIPLVCLSSRDFRRRLSEKVVRKGTPLPEWRRSYDREVMRLLEPYPFDVGMLAGYMLIFCEEAAQRYDLLNLHPAAPGGPKGIWQDVIWELIEQRAERAGVMIHLATPDLDEGPVVAYCNYSLRSREFDRLWEDVEGLTLEELKTAAGEQHPLFLAIRRAGLARESPLIVETLRAFADGRVRIDGKAVVDEKGEPIDGYDLTDEIEQLIAAKQRQGI